MNQNRGNRGDCMEQLSFSEDDILNMDSSLVVAQANALVRGKQNLKLNSIKLIRFIIMQISLEDRHIHSYTVTISEIASILNVSSSNIYRDIENITDDISNNPVYIREVVNGRTKEFIKIPWCSFCHYVEGKGLTIKLNDTLKPYLLNLRKNYLQYELKDILAMHSIYAIRIYELIQSRLMRGLPIGGRKDITISLKELREGCSCENKYMQFAHFRTKVLDVAKAEINRCAVYNLEYSCVKKSKKVVSITFHLQSKFKAKQ